MILESYGSIEKLYLARGDEVNPLRPLLTGDVVETVDIPGVQEGARAVVIAHPCQMRRGVALDAKILCALVRTHPPVDEPAWATGFYDRTPFPDLMGDSTLYVGDFTAVGLVESHELENGRRLACLQHFGVNLLQQRLVNHLTRVEIETDKFDDACAAVLEEADLLEEFRGEVVPVGIDIAEADAGFHDFIRADRDGGKSYQDWLRERQLRPQVRRACRAEALRVVAATRAGQ